MVVEGPTVIVLILRKYLLFALGIPYSLTIGESIAMGVVGVPKRHALHSVAVIAMRVHEI